MVTEINLTPTASAVEITGPARPSSNGQGEMLYRPGTLPGRTWGTASECVSAAILVHGIGAHSGWFEALGRRLKVRRIYALAYDQIGFGKRQHESFQSHRQWLHDLQAVYEHMQQVTGDKPIFLLGNSMGAVLAYKAVSAGLVKPAGLVMFSPGFDGNPSTFSLSYRIRALLQSFIKPDSEIALPYTVDAVAREYAVKKWLSNDGERRFSVPARMLLELLKLTTEINQSQKKLSCPMLMMTAGVENIVDNRANDRLFSQVQCPSKTLKHFPEAWHDLMFDPVMDELVSDLANWIAESSPNKKQQTA